MLANQIGLLQNFQCCYRFLHCCCRFLHSCLGLIALKLTNHSPVSFLYNYIIKNAIYLKEFLFSKLWSFLIMFVVGIIKKLIYNWGKYRKSKAAHTSCSFSSQCIAHQPIKWSFICHLYYNDKYSTSKS